MNNNIYKDFAKRLRDLLESKDMKQVDLAKALDMTEASISFYLKGTRLPKYETLVGMARILSTTPEYLLNIEDTEKKLDTVELPAKTFYIPILGEVRAGKPSIILEDNIVGYESLDIKLKNSGEYFGLRVKGDSMSPRMQDGDVVIVRRQNDIESGAVGVVLVNGNEATIKKIKKSANGLTLIPYNSAYDPIYYNNDDIISLPVLILGVVIELRAKI